MKISKMSVELIDYCGTDLSVVNAARVSFHKESEFGYDLNTSNPKLLDKDEKLINYLAKHKHHSPFNHAFLTFRVKAPIFVARQLVKHKFMPWNEVSRRYVDDEPEFYFPEYWREKAENVKQGSSLNEAYNGDMFDRDFKHLNQKMIDLYNLANTYNIAPELARMVLPQNMMTEWWWSGTLGAFGDMLKLRLDPHAQQESREIAQMIYERIEELFPVSIKAMLEN